MLPTFRGAAFAVLCDAEGIVEAVFRDDLALLAQHDGPARLAAVLDPGCGPKLRRFLEALGRQAVAIDWSFDLARRDAAGRLHVAGARVAPGFLVVGAAESAALRPACEALSRSGDPRVAPLRAQFAAMAAQADRGPATRAFGEIEPLREQVQLARQELLQRQAAAGTPADRCRIGQVELTVAEPPARPRDAARRWHEVLTLPGGQILVTAGAVAGEEGERPRLRLDIQAAMRTLALQEHAPFAILTLTSRLVRFRSRGVGGARALLGTLDPVSWVFTYSTAEHLPPIVAAPGRPAEFLPAGGPPLGACDAGSAGLHPARSARLPERAVLAVYAHDFIAYGAAALLQAATAERDSPSPDAAEAVLRRVAGPSAGVADGAVVVVRIRPPA